MVLDMQHDVLMRIRHDDAMCPKPAEDLHAHFVAHMQPLAHVRQMEAQFEIERGRTKAQEFDMRLGIAQNLRHSPGNSSINAWYSVASSSSSIAEVASSMYSHCGA